MLIWSIGEVLWDVFPESETLGGAPLNVCANLQRLGDQAMLLSAVGDDLRGHRALEQMQALGLSIDGMRIVPSLPTGIAVVNESEDREASFVIPRPAAFDELYTNPELFETAKNTRVDWLYFGTLLQTNQTLERFTTQLATQPNQTRTFYDMNLRTGHWNLELVQRLSRLASVLKLNDVEAETLFRLAWEEDATYSLEAFCSTWAPLDA
jgi:fructokinase